MKALVVCPSRGRPERLLEMLLSFYQTRTAGLTSLFVYVDDLDPEVESYREIARMMERASAVDRLGFGPRKTIVEVFNGAVAGFDYYVDCNDDFIFQTMGWDQKLMAAIAAKAPAVGCAYGRTKNLPCGTMTARRSIEALGWWMYPGCRHQFVDNIQRDLYAAAGQLYFVPDVFVEHRHPLLGAAVEMDATYRYAYSDEVRSHDEAAYREWLEFEAMGDVAKLRGVRDF